jgi:DNA-binding transcriptional ArsR family regulator
MKGLERSQRLQDVIDKHHIAQKLLEPLPVVIPYVMEMDFPSKLIRNRRDYQRFLDLINASAFLHQFQRLHGRLNSKEYILAAQEDYEITYWLIEPILIHTLDDYIVKARVLLNGIREMVKKRAETERKSLRQIIFTRSKIADSLGWTKRQVRSHIKELEELEAVEVIRGGRGREYKYKLLHDSANTGFRKLLKIVNKLRTQLTQKVSENNAEE